MRRAVVTGGAGFLGKHVIRRLLAAGWFLRCPVRSDESVRTIQGLTAGPDHRLDVQTVDLREASAIRDLVKDADIVIHMAAAGGGSAAALFSDTVSATRVLVSVAAERQLPVLLVSSFSVYRTDHLRAGNVLDETCPLEPRPELRDAYAFSKLAQERVCVEAAERFMLPLAIIRPSVIYGPGRGLLSSRVGLQVGGNLFRFGSRHRVPYVYVENCADGIVAAAESQSGWGEAINLVDDDLPTPRRLTAAASQGRRPPRVIALPLPAAMLGVRLYSWLADWSDGMLPPTLTPYKAAAQWKPLRYPNVKAKRVLGWTPRVGLEEAISATLAWERSEAA